MLANKIENLGYSNVISHLLKMNLAPTKRLFKTNLSLICNYNNNKE